MKESKTAYKSLLKHTCGNGNVTEVLETLFGRLDHVELLNAENVLAIGPGVGIRETHFLKKCIPNLKKAVFLEPRKDCFDLLNENLTSSFGLEVEIRTFNCKFEEWKMNEDKFDVILMIHSLYDFGDEVRRMTLNKCLNELLTPNGLLCIMMVDETLQDNTRGSLLNMVYRELGVKNQIEINTVKKDLIPIGNIVHEYHYEITRDYSSFDINTVRFIHLGCKNEKSENDVLQALEAIKNKGYLGVESESLLVVKGCNVNKLLFVPNL